MGVSVFSALRAGIGCAKQMNNSRQSVKPETTEKLISIFIVVCKVAFPLLGVAVVLALTVPLCFSDLPAKVLTAKLTFAGLGLLFAILQVFLGVLLTLIGVTSEYNVDASVGSAKMKLASSSPGMLLVLIGTALFAFALKGDFEVMSTTMQQGTQENHSSESASDKGLNVAPLKGVEGPE